MELVNPVQLVYERYLAWYRTQGDPHENRAPGATCLAALGSGYMGTLDEPLNDSKGCGGAMRTAPVGLWIDPPHAFQLAAEFAAITHGHPSGYLSAGLIAEIVAHVRCGKALPAAVTAAKRTLTKYAGHEETLAALTRAQALAKKTAAGKCTPAEAVAALGEGWVGEEAVAIVVYCALVYPADYQQAVRTAVNITGDSDSTGAITGALVGTLVGYDKLPKKWVGRVERRDDFWRVGKTYFLDVDIGKPNGD